MPDNSFIYSCLLLKKALVSKLYSISILLLINFTHFPPNLFNQSMLLIFFFQINVLWQRLWTSTQNKAQNFISAKVHITLSSMMLTLTSKTPIKTENSSYNIWQILNIQDALTQQTQSLLLNWFWLVLSSSSAMKKLSKLPIPRVHSRTSRRTWIWGLNHIFWLLNNTPSS